ncbi:MAG TPA: hypothetical protein VHW00_06835 [Thermoanaerobaculia bacterium]|nr:hypothetical protein [Thermoanaerobaculia bacterium]
MTHYAVATLEELWSNDRLMERRLSHGQATQNDAEILATDVRDDALVEACERAMSEARVQCVAPHRRIVVEATRESVATIVVLRDADCSLVTDPAHFARDSALLQSIAAIPVEASRVDEALPLVWRNGSAAVLLHEAIGHPLEHAHAAIAWPSWLDVDVPLAMRRASFRDVPMQRMERLVASQRGASLEVPRQRIDVLLVDGGAYEPLTETVTLHIAAADLVDGANAQRLPPFTLAKTRGEIARALAGAEGEPIRYPGVICSREGQELYVPSFAPLMLTVFA